MVVARKCPQCAKNVTAQANFCPSCGVDLASKLACASCATPLPPGTRYCFQCGEKVGGSGRTACSRGARALTAGPLPAAARGQGGEAGFVVASSCPRCGAPLDFAEGSNAVRCAHCASMLLVTGRRRVLSYAIRPRVTPSDARSLAGFTRRGRRAAGTAGRAAAGVRAVLPAERGGGLLASRAGRRVARDPRRHR